MDYLDLGDIQEARLRNALYAAGTLDRSDQGDLEEDRHWAENPGERGTERLLAMQHRLLAVQDQVDRVTLALWDLLQSPEGQAAGSHWPSMEVVDAAMAFANSQQKDGTAHLTVVEPDHYDVVAILPATSGAVHVIQVPLNAIERPFDSWLLYSDGRPIVGLVTDVCVVDGVQELRVVPHRLPE